MNELASYEKRIRELAPEVAVNSVSLNRDGLLNDIVIVNGELVFRFQKHEYGFKHLKDEARILRLLQNYITLEIPSPLYESDDCLAYRMIPGETFRRDICITSSLTGRGSASTASLISDVPAWAILPLISA